MNDVKCVCGHVNPQGTILCEACGRALTEEAKKKTCMICVMRAVPEGLKHTIKRWLTKYGTSFRLSRWECG